MTKKKCLVYETLNNVQNLQIVEGANPNEVRLSGVFGVCGIKNNNNRIYDKGNYAKMVEALQTQIAGEGCPGELEHPNTMNITLENISHKIESIEMNEDGTITGTILLLNTPKGQIAKAIVEGGLPLFISSRGAGSIDESGRVTLSTIKTYDLVGTPGFSQAKLTLKKNQALECLNESAEDGENVGAIWAIVEGDDLLGGDDDKSDGKDKSDDLLDGDGSDDKKKEKTEKEPEEKDKKNDSSDEDDDDKQKDNNGEPTMKEIKDAIDALKEKVTNLEAELHIAQESLSAKETTINELNEKLNSLEIPAAVNYNAIETWIKEEFAPEYTNNIMEDVQSSIDESVEVIANAVQGWVCEEFAPEVQNWVCEEFAPEVQNWVCEEFAPEVQNWVCEEFAPEVQNWVCEEFAPEVQNWVCEEFAPEVQNWVCEEFAPTVEGWITEEFAPEHTENIENKVNENVSAFLESQKTTKLSEIDALLDTIDNKDNNVALTSLKESYNIAGDKFKGVYAVENMPSEFRPVWEGLTDEKKSEIVRQSRAYDFTKEGVLERFWASTNMVEEKPINENNNNQPITGNYYSSIAARMMAMRH